MHVRAALRSSLAAVKITLLSDVAIRLEATADGMTIEGMSADLTYSPFHMLGSSLAYCTFSVMYSWATHVGLAADDLTIEVRWAFADDPYRVGRLDVRFAWPSLPAKRLDAAKRVAEMCTVHATLRHPPTISIDGSAAPAEAAA